MSEGISVNRDMNPLVEVTGMACPTSALHFGHEHFAKLLLSFEMCETCLQGLLGNLT